MFVLRDVEANKIPTKQQVKSADKIPTNQPANPNKSASKNPNKSPNQIPYPNKPNPISKQTTS